MPKYNYGNESRAKLRTCHPDLQLIFNEAIKYYDIVILEGARKTERQQELYNKSLLQVAAGGPAITNCDGIIYKSAHQVREDGYSWAVDAAPFPVKWGDVKRFFFMAGIVISTAERLYAEGKIYHLVRWGHDWDMDRVFDDQTFNDSPHFELYNP